MPHLLFLVTEDWYFVSHRLALARAARDAGYRVSVVTRVVEHGALLAREGLHVIPFHLRRRGALPLADAAALARLVRLYRRERPDIAHHVALKPVLVGSVAARLAGVPGVVNAVAGMGLAFSAGGGGRRLLRGALTAALGRVLALGGSRVIVQNPDDRQVLLARAGVPAARIVLIRGAGVDTEAFRPAPEPAPGAPFTVAMVSRMIWPKGVAEFVEAARTLKREGANVRMLLVGRPDADNPAAVPEWQLRAWHEEGVVQWLGHVDDVSALWRRTHLCALPSWYREGVPKSLMEAAASGRPIVTTDTPGCRDVVAHGENGLLIPPRDAAALARAIHTLAADPAARRRMGELGRERMLAGFGDATVIGRTLALYRELLDGPSPGDQVGAR